MLRGPPASVSDAPGDESPDIAADSEHDQDVVLCCRVSKDSCSDFVAVARARRLVDPTVIRTILLVANVFVSLLLMVLCCEAAWDRETQQYHSDAGTERYRWVILVLTILLEGQLIEYYVNAYRAKRRFVVSFDKQGTARLHQKTKPRNLQIWMLGLEMILCGLIPLPGDALGFSVRSGLLMFLRLYLVFRLLHQCTAVYAFRDDLLAIHTAAGDEAARAAASVRFDVVFSLRTIFDAQPTLFLLVIVLATYFPIAFCIYV